MSPMTMFSQAAEDLCGSSVSTLAEMPRRSVTRFFIPMIDVLTLLFCIYLLMPMVAAAPDRRARASAETALVRSSPEARNQPET